MEGTPEPRVPRPTHRLRIAAVVALLIGLTAWGLTDVRRRGSLDPEKPWRHRTDLTVYTTAAAAFLDPEKDPYLVTSPRGWHYLYPPVFALLLIPLTPFPPGVQALLWFAITVLLGYGCLRETARMLRRLPVRAVPPWIAGCALVASLVPALNCIQRGQVGIFILYFLLLGARLAVLGGTPWARAAGGVVLALPVAVKLTPALPVAVLAGILWLVPRSGALRSSAGVACGLILWLLLLPAAVVGWDANLRHLRTWVDRVVRNPDVAEENDFFAASRRNQSFQNAVRLFASRFQDADPAVAAPRSPGRARAEMLAALPWEGLDRAIRGARLGFLALLAVAALRLGRGGSRLEILAAFGLASTATLLYSPLSWGHHYVIQWPGLVFVPLLFLEAGRRRTATVLAAAPAAASAAHYALLDVVGSLGALGIVTAAWFVVATTLIAAGAVRPLNR